MAKTSVRSATFDPNKVPSPNSGNPSSEELMATKVSGNIDITATTIKPMVYFDSLKFLANLTAYLVANVAPLTTKNNEAIRINILLNIFWYFTFFYLLGRLGQ